jgi:hypothetical protein
MNENTEDRKSLKWTPVTPVAIKSILGVMLLIGTQHQSSPREDYWDFQPYAPREENKTAQKETNADNG